MSDECDQVHPKRDDGVEGIGEIQPPLAELHALVYLALMPLAAKVHEITEAQRSAAREAQYRLRVWGQMVADTRCDDWEDAP